MFIFYLFIFIISFFLLAFSSKRLIRSLSRLAKVLGWKEFVVAFFTFALAGSIPNFSVGISSALHKIPELSFAEIVGGNIVDLTLAVALVVLISKRGLKLPSRVVQGSAWFTLGIAVLPLLLLLDGVISRADGFTLIISFFVYAVWLFARKERFHKTYNHLSKNAKFRGFFRHLLNLVVMLFLLFLAAEGIVRSAQFFSKSLGLPLALIGILVVGLGNALPEIFFGIQAAKKRQDWMVIGNLMGAVIFPATLVLGIVALISPIEIVDVSLFAVSRIFLIISAVFFLIFVRSGKKITKREAKLLLFVYLCFLLAIFVIAW